MVITTSLMAANCCASASPLGLFKSSRMPYLSVFKLLKYKLALGLAGSPIFGS